MRITLSHKGVFITFLVVFSLYVSCIDARSEGLPDSTKIQLYNCNGSFRQQWSTSYLSKDQTLRLDNDTNMCLDISGYGTQDRSRIWLYGCHTGDKDPTHQNQEFVWDTTTGTIKSTLSGKCLDAPNSPLVGATIVIMTCSNTNTQKWTYSANDHSIRNQNGGLCLDAGSPLPRTCDEAPGKTLPFCNPSLSIATRVADIISRISLTEKIGLFGNDADAVPSLNIVDYQWWSEALHGVAGSPGVSFGGSTPVATSFPQVILTSASFDTELFYAIGTTISTEARAFSNAGNAGLTYWAPNLNIFRDPRWGRGQETPGEDPYLTSQYVKNFVTGLQGPDAKYLKVSACCKHYAAYSLEDYKGMDRHHYNAVVSDQDLSDTYFPAFRTCISPDGAGASGIMCSYNSVNGIPSCANEFLLTTEARKTWKFNGYITGDCGAVDDVQYTHQYTTNTDATCAAVLKAGTDIDCGTFLPAHLQHAVQVGAVNNSLLDRALTNLFSVQMRLGMFDPPASQPYMQIQPSAVNTPASQALAEKAAVEGIVLLKNEKDVLPLAKGKNIAVIGPHAQATDAMKGNYAGNSPYIISPQQGLSAYYTTTYAAGCAITGTDTSGFAAACTLAGKSDATVLVVGINQEIESEGRDRVEISLTGVQDQLVSHVASCAAGKPVIVVVLSGSSVDLSMIKSNSNVSSIVWAGYPGQSGGTAIAKIVSGTVAPSGRLPFTMYNADFVNKEDFLSMNMRPSTVWPSPGRTYRFYTDMPVYPFGFGLSYTTFSYQWSTLKREFKREQIHSIITAGDYSPYTTEPLADETVIVTNTGKVTADVSVLAYVIGPNPGKNGNPLTQLVGFKRVFALAPGQNAKIVFPISAQDLSYTGKDGKLYTQGGVWKLKVEGEIKEINVV
jgi:beta-glucosidase-like glycosyl hydrolase